MLYKVKSFANIKYCVGHHVGGLYYMPYASTQNETAEDINKHHKERWSDFVSSLGFWGGYNFFIDKNGTLSQFRAIGEETAAQIGHNQDSVSICLAGNFSINPANNATIDTPTQAQIKTLSNLMSYLMDNGIKLQNIVPHRALGQTECYGVALKDDWARQIAKAELERKMKLISQLLMIYYQLFDLLRKGKLSFMGLFKAQKIGLFEKYKYTDDPNLGRG